MPADATQITQPRVVLVEGGDDRMVLEQLISHMGIEDVQILELRGTPTPAKVRAVASTPGFGEVVSLGVVRDADASAVDAFRSVCGAIREAGLSEPASPVTPAGQNPCVSVLIWSYDAGSGMLEDVCLRSVEEDGAMSCVNDYFDCLRSRVGDGCSFPRNEPKARVQVFLASREETGMMVGCAAERGHWNLDHEAFEQAREFVRQLASG